MKNSNSMRSSLNLMIITVILLVFTAACAQKAAKQQESAHFITRGLVLDVNDLSTVDWPKRAKEAGLTTLATHITPGQVAEFIQSDRGQQFLAECKEHGIEVEHELHSMGHLLPRSLFEEDSTMFRMNEEGRRVADYNKILPQIGQDRRFPI